MSETVAQPKASGEADVVDWRTLINGATARRPEPVQAQTFLRRYQTASQAVELGCADGNFYVVKALRNDLQQGRMVFNDQVAARLGALLNAPVPEVALVEITAELIAANPDQKKQMGHILPGTAHGSLRIQGVTERINSFDHPDEADNRVRYAVLAVFFGWLVAGDPQFIFKKAPPRLVYSHDHGHFFPGGPNWTIATLQRAPTPQADIALVSRLKLLPEELVRACAPLRGVLPEQIAHALAVPPDEWGVSLDERAALGELLYSRRASLLAAHGGTRRPE